MTEHYLDQLQKWPAVGKHILAQFTEDYIVVYQAYRPSIASFAVACQFFGGDEFSYSRMSWIKTNFLWMMYRSGWGQKLGQEATLAIKLRIEYFESLLEGAVGSAFDETRFASREDWQQTLKLSDVRLQWDPDHDPHGQKLCRRAIQLGIRNDELQAFKGDGILEIEDISRFVVEQREIALSGDWACLLTPSERPYLPRSELAARRIGLDM